MNHRTLRSLLGTTALLVTLVAFAAPAGAVDPLPPPDSCTLNATIHYVEVTFEGHPDAEYDIWRNGHIIATVPGFQGAFADVDAPPGEVHYSVSVRPAVVPDWRRYCGSVVRPPLDTERPSVPGAPYGEVLGETSFHLMWRPATDNVGVRSYYIYLNNRLHAFVVPDDASAPETTLTDLNAGTDYWVYIRAVDLAGNIGWRTGYRSFTTPLGTIDNQRPSVPGWRILVDGNEVSWGASTDNVAVAKYLLFDAATDYVVTESIDTSVELPPGEYSLYVKAEDTAGNRSWRTSIATFTIDA